MIALPTANMGHLQVLPSYAFAPNFFMSLFHGLKHLIRIPNACSWTSSS